MVKEITKYESNDGELYDTREEAVKHDLIFALQESFEFSPCVAEYVLQHKDKLIQFLTNLDKDPVNKPPIAEDEYTILWCSLSGDACVNECAPDCKVCEIPKEYNMEK